MKKLGMFVLGFAAVVFAAGFAQAATSDDDTGGAKFSIHGEVRFRGEYWNNMTDFTNKTSTFFDDAFDVYPYRVRLAAKGDLGHDVWVYGEFQSADVAGGDVQGQTQPLFGNNGLKGGVDLYQGWVKLKDIGNTNLDITFGRQEIVFDRGLHFSSLDFYNGISHDGVMFNWDWSKVNIAAFWTRPVELNNFFFGLNPESSSDSDNLGVHAGLMVGKDKDQDVAGYLFFQNENSTFLNPGQDRGKIYTLGGRWGRMLHGKTGFVWNAEASYQFGDFQPCAVGATVVSQFIFGPPAACLDNADSQKAVVFEGSFGWMWHQGKTDHKFWGGYTYASGDSDPNDTDQKGFIPLYTDFHNRLGYADLFNITNIKAINLGWKMMMDKHTVGVAFWNFTQAKTEAGTGPSPVTASIFNPFASFVVDPCFDGQTPPSGQSCSDKLGNEVDVFYTYAMTQNFSFDTALSWFKAGDAIKDELTGFGTATAPFDEQGKDAAYRLTLQARARF